MACQRDPRRAEALIARLDGPSAHGTHAKGTEETRRRAARRYPLGLTTRRERGRSPAQRANIGEAPLLLLDRPIVHDGERSPIGGRELLEDDSEAIIVRVD